MFNSIAGVINLANLSMRADARPMASNGDESFGKGFCLENPLTLLAFPVAMLATCGVVTIAALVDGHNVNQSIPVPIKKTLRNDQSQHSEIVEPHGK